MIISRLSRNVLTNSVMSIINGVLQLLLIMVVGRLTDETFFASFLIALALIAISEHGSEFGSSVWGMQRYASAMDPKKVLSISFQVKAFFSLILLCILLILPIPTLSFVQVFLCFLIAVSQPSADPVLWFLRGTERLDKDALVLVIWKAGTVSSMATTLWLGGNLDMMLIAWFCINVLRQVSVYLILKPLFSRPSYSASGEPAKNALTGTEQVLQSPLQDTPRTVVRHALPTGASSLLMAMNQRVLLFVMGFIATAADLSLFGAAHTLVSQAGFLAMALVLSYLPSLARTQDAALVSGDNSELRNMLRCKFARISLFVGSFCLLGMLASPIISAIVFGQKYPLVDQLMTTLWPGLFLWSISISLRFVLALRRCAWIDLTGSASGLFSSVVLLWIGALTIDAGETLVWVASAAWITGLVIECSVKIVGLVKLSALPVRSAVSICLWFAGICGAAALVLFDTLEGYFFS